MSKVADRDRGRVEGPGQANPAAFVVGARQLEEVPHVRGVSDLLE